MKTGVCTTDFEKLPLVTADRLFGQIRELGFCCVQFAFSSVLETDFVPTGQLELPGRIPPAVLGAAGLLEDRRFCCYPGIEAQIDAGTYDPEAVTVRDGNIVTGTGPGTAAAFALELLEALEGREARDKVAAGMLL